VYYLATAVCGSTVLAWSKYAILYKQQSNWNVFPPVAENKSNKQIKYRTHGCLNIFICTLLGVHCMSDTIVVGLKKIYIVGHITRIYSFFKQ
jgi:hypothetical protein